jgi:hypothetical protein
MNCTARPCHGTAVGLQDELYSQTMSWHCCWSLAFQCGHQGSVSSPSLCDMWHSEWLRNRFLSDNFGVLLPLSFILLSQTLYMIMAVVSIVQYNTQYNTNCSVKGELAVLRVRLTLRVATLQHSDIS